MGSLRMTLNQGGKQKSVGLSLFLYAVGLVLSLIHVKCIRQWHYEYYYYIETKPVSNYQYSVKIPLPHTLRIPDIPKKDWLPNFSKYYTTNIVVQKGACKCELVLQQGIYYLQITASSPIIIVSTFKLHGFDTNIADISLRTQEYDSIMIYSDTDSLCVIIDARAITRFNNNRRWKFYYSAVINQTREYPIVTKQTWNHHLPFEYLVMLERGWKTYAVKEGKGRL